MYACMHAHTYACMDDCTYVCILKIVATIYLIS